jgi:hypothetical protein
MTTLSGSIAPPPALTAYAALVIAITVVLWSGSRVLNLAEKALP